MPDMPLIFDRMQLPVRARRARALGPAPFLLDRVVGDLAERLAIVVRTFDIGVDLGTPGDALLRRLAGNPAIGTLVRTTTSGEGPARSGPTVIADEEALPFGAATLDLVVSALALQSVNDLPGTLIQIRRALRPDGLLLGAMLGGDTLNELRDSFVAAETEMEGGVSPRVAPFVDVRQAGALLQRAQFALPVTDVDRVIVRYASPFTLMDDLRRMGATGVLSERRRTPLRRATLLRMAEIYARDFSDADGRVRATFDIVWLSGWAPHATQQQALKPGSARARLADALGVTEHSSGEKVEK